ncbi:MAG: purine-binding chemotaxis protein CheW [Thermoleophilia bacterium]|nr:purine-binding chemotaxis protein CheW [Thermoleophilia bacterium]
MVAQDHDMQIVTFRIGRERFALPTGSAREVILYELPRRLPGSNKWVDGVINLRGEIIPVCDLLLALGIDGVTKREQIIVCDAPGGSLGLIVEEVTSVIRVTADEIKHPAALDHPALAGLVELGNDLVVLLDIDAALGEYPLTPDMIASLRDSETPIVATTIVTTVRDDAASREAA